MSSASSYFLLFLYFRKVVKESPQKISRKIGEGGVFTRSEDGVQRIARDGHLGGPRCGIEGTRALWPPWPSGIPSRCLFAYIKPPYLKVTDPGGFPQIGYIAPPPSKPSFEGQKVLIRYVVGTGIGPWGHLHRCCCLWDGL